MLCYVYKSRKQYNMYLYLRERDNFAAVPEALMKKFGTPEFALDFELTPERQLAREDSAEVLHNLKEQGFHLQMPDQLDILKPLDTRYN